MIFAIVLMGCNSDKSKTKIENPEFSTTEMKTDTLTKHLKPFNPELPTIGLLMYNGVLQSEVIATSDVFAKPTEDGKQLFNVISIAETESQITTEEGMHFVPDVDWWRKRFAKGISEFKSARRQFGNIC